MLTRNCLPVKYDWNQADTRQRDRPISQVCQLKFCGRWYRMLHSSLNLDIFPTAFKTSMVKHPLKKSDLDYSELNNYRSFSNLPALGTPLEKGATVSRQNLHLSLKSSTRSSTNPVVHGGKVFTWCENRLITPLLMLHFTTTVSGQLFDVERLVLKKDTVVVL